MRPRLCLAIAALFVAGCTEQEPLAPAFAGDWVTARVGCKPSGPRINLNKTGMSASGSSINIVTFSSATVSGATAHLKIELSAATRLAAGLQQSASSKARAEHLDYEVAATLIASSARITPTNVIVRDKRTRRIEAIDRDVLDLLTLVRCDRMPERDGGVRAETAKAGQRRTLPP